MVKSKKPRRGRPACSAELATSRLVLEPISVVMPPRMQAKLSGIMTLLTERCTRSAKAVISGMKITTTGVLFITALITAAAPRAKARASTGWCRRTAASCRAGWSSAPVCTMPWPTTNSASTAINAGSAKPAISARASSRLAPSGPLTGKT